MEISFFSKVLNAIGNLYICLYTAPTFHAFLTNGEIMTESVVAISSHDQAARAGEEIANQIRKEFNGQEPHAVLVFASSRYDYSALLKSISVGCNPQILIGCSSAGEFTNEALKEGAVCAVALRSDHLKFSAGLGTSIRTQKNAAAEQIVSSFKGLKGNDYRYHTAIVMTDALAGYTDDFIQALTLQMAGKYQLVGGGAGDDAKFSQTHVFYGTEAYNDAAVALEILSNEPVGIGVKHGWESSSVALRATETDGSRLISINSKPAVEVFEDFAKKTQQNFDPKNPISFFLHNVIGINTSTGYKLRVPLAVNGDGSVSCASDIPNGATIHIMRTTHASAAEAASCAAETALGQLAGRSPKVAIFFDCVATRLRLGVDFGLELKALSNSLDGAQFIGCNTYGQIARVDGQFSGFHNCTAVACLLP
jgi:hypothetical protein